MTPQQSSLLQHHLQFASESTSPATPVYVILGLEDAAGFEIASIFRDDCKEQRDRIQQSGAYPSLTIAMEIRDADELLALVAPGACRIGQVPTNMTFLILIADDCCLTALLPRA